MGNLSSNPQFTRAELEFIRTEFYASLSNGAKDPLFEAVYRKSKAILNGTTDETKREPPKFNTLIGRVDGSIIPGQSDTCPTCGGGYVWAFEGWMHDCRPAQKTSGDSHE